MDEIKKSYLSLDLRSLALWRMALGAMVLLDIVGRLVDLQMFYGNEGLLSIEHCLEQNWLPPVYHLFLASDSTGGLLFLFACWALAAFCLMIGYKTRLAAAITWYFVVSIQLRNPMVLDGGDEVLRVFLFWAPFLPLSARWSYDAKKAPEWRELPNSYRSIATIGVFLQMALIYLFAAILKNGADWLKTQDALYYTLSIDQFTTRFGQFLSQYPEQLRPLTTMALGVEYLLPVLLLLPLQVKFARWLFLILAVALHLGIASLLHFGIFMIIMIACLLVFVPGEFFDRFYPETRDQESERSPQSFPGGYKLSKISQGFAAFICFYIIYVNVQSIEQRHKLNDFAHAVAFWTYEHQHWHFFAPHPFRQDGFFVFEIETPEGVIDAFQLQPPDENGKPKLGSARFPNQRWRRWLQNLMQIDIPDKVAWRANTLDYLAREWAKDNPDLTIGTMRLIFMEEMTPPPGEKAVLKRIVLAER